MVNKREIWIAVPTYWTFSSCERADELVLFDHPTPLDEQGTLVRTLESFRNLEGSFNVLIVAAATSPALGPRVHQQVMGLISPFAADFPLHLISPVNLPTLNRALSEPILRLDSYGNIRNVQLALSFAAGARTVVGIDDDEVIKDAKYLTKVRDAVGKRFGQEWVAGVAGPYFDAKGEYGIAGVEELAKEKNVFLKKNFFINEALKKVMQPHGARQVMRSNVAFGGNMAMDRETIVRVCHDPYIPRGEDFDYVINAYMQNLFFYFLPEAGIVHLPPDSTGSQAADKPSKLVADIARFIYMKVKWNEYRRLFPHGPADREYLMPYPGVYLEETLDLKREGIDALDRMYPAFRETRSPELFVEEAERTAYLKAAEYFAYRSKWERVLRQLAQSPLDPVLVSTFRVTRLRGTTLDGQ